MNARSAEEQAAKEMWLATYCEDTRRPALNTSDVRVTCRRNVLTGTLEVCKIWITQGRREGREANAPSGS